MTLRILHVLDTCGAGGMETTFLNVLTAWRTHSEWADHRVLAFDGGALEIPLRASTSDLLVTSEPERIVRALGGPHDVVHFLFDRAAYRWLPDVAARSRAAVVYGKGYDLAGSFRSNDGLRWQPDESLMWGCDRITFTTAALAAGYQTPAGRASVLGKAADVGHFLDIPEPSGTTPDRLVCVANLHVLKRLGDLVRAVGLVRAAHPAVRLRFVGADATGERERLERLARDLGVLEACEWVGRRGDVAQDLAESRVFVLASGREGVPTAMIEAMAAARPVVMTDVGHVSHVVRDGVEGYLVAVGDVRALADRLGLLLADRERAIEMGRAGRQRAAMHDVSAVAGRLREVLEQAAAARPRPGAVA